MLVVGGIVDLAWTVVGYQADIHCFFSVLHTITDPILPISFILSASFILCLLVWRYQVEKDVLIVWLNLQLLGQCTYSIVQEPCEVEIVKPGSIK